MPGRQEYFERYKVNNARIPTRENINVQERKKRNVGRDVTRDEKSEVLIMKGPWNREGVKIKLVNKEFAVKKEIKYPYVFWETRNESQEEGRQKSQCFKQVHAQHRRALFFQKKGVIHKCLVH